MSRHTFLKLAFYSLLATLGMALLWWIFEQLTPPDLWQGMKLSKSAFEREYCEFNNPLSSFHQVMNTFSNLTYFFFGFLALQIGLHDRGRESTNRLSMFPELSLFCGGVFIYLAFGSAFFHASLTQVSQYVDMNGTYGLTFMLIVLGLNDVIKFNFQSHAGLILILLTLAVLSFYGWYFLIPSSRLMPLMFLISILLSLVSLFKSWNWFRMILLVSSILILFFAIKIRTDDVMKLRCDPFSIWQGHAFWHLLTGLSSFMTYAFYRFRK